MCLRQLDLSCVLASQRQSRVFRFVGTNDEVYGKGVN